MPNTAVLNVFQLQTGEGHKFLSSSQPQHSLRGLPGSGQTSAPPQQQKKVLYIPWEIRK